MVNNIDTAATGTADPIVVLVDAVKSNNGLFDALSQLPSGQHAIAAGQLQNLLAETQNLDIIGRIVRTVSQMELPPEQSINILTRVLTGPSDAKTQQATLTVIGNIARQTPAAAADALPGVLTVMEDSQVTLEAYQLANTLLGEFISQLNSEFENAGNAAGKANVINQINSVPLEKLNDLLNGQRLESGLDGATIAKYQKSAAAALGIGGNPNAIQKLTEYVRNEELRQQNERESGSDQLALLNADQNRIAIMLSVINALQMQHQEAGVTALNMILNQDRNFRVKRAAAATLGSLGFASGIPSLAAAFISDPDNAVRDVAGQALQKITNWEMKTEEVIKALSNRKTDGPIDTHRVITTLRPMPEQTPRPDEALGNLLIQHAIRNQNNPALIAPISSLVVASANGSKNIAAERIDLFQTNHPDQPREAIDALRVEIGSAKVLEPILDKLEENLQKNFQEPINKLNDETQLMWQNTIKRAYFGFTIRVAMTVVAFGIGVYMVLRSFNGLLNGTFTLQELFGPGVFLVGGIGLMVATIYRGPLSEIRKSVNDVAIANAAFIGYIHRVLEISHTFSYYYLQNQITFEELEKASKLINDAMGNTINMLNNSTSTDTDSGQVLPNLPKIEDINGAPRG